jgi:hypothetical protein
MEFCPVFIVGEFQGLLHAVCNGQIEILISGSCGWETGSVYFDTVKIYRRIACIKGDTGLAEQAFIPVVEYV